MGWCKVCLGGKGKHTDIRVGSRESSEESFRGLTQVCNRITEQTYPDLLLVNIPLTYPHRERTTNEKFRVPATISRPLCVVYREFLVEETGNSAFDR